MFTKHCSSDRSPPPPPRPNPEVSGSSGGGEGQSDGGSYESSHESSYGSSPAPIAPPSSSSTKDERGSRSQPSAFRAPSLRTHQCPPPPPGPSLATGSGAEGNPWRPPPALLSGGPSERSLGGCRNTWRRGVSLGRESPPAARARGTRESRNPVYLGGGLITPFVRRMYQIDAPGASNSPFFREMPLNRSIHHGASSDAPGASHLWLGEQGGRRLGRAENFG